MGIYEGAAERLFFAVISQIISVVLSIILPILSSKLIVAYTDSIYKQILQIALAIMAVRIVNNVFLFAASHNYNIVYSKTLSSMEKDMVDSTLKITKSCMDEQGSGLFIQRLTVDTTRLATGFNTIADMSTSIFRYVGILGAIIYIDLKVFFVILILVLMQGLLERHNMTPRGASYCVSLYPP